MPVADGDIDIDAIDDVRFHSEIKIRYSRKRHQFFAAVDGEKVTGASNETVKALVQAKLDARAPFVYQSAIKISVELEPRSSSKPNEGTPPIFNVARCEIAQSGQEWWARGAGAKGFGNVIAGRDDRKGAVLPTALPFTLFTYNTAILYTPFAPETWGQLQEVANAARAFHRAQQVVLRGIAGRALDAVPDGLPELAGVAAVLTRSLAPLIASATPGESDAAE